MNRTAESHRFIDHGQTGNHRDFPGHRCLATIASLLIVCTTMSSRTLAQEGNVINREYEIKAAYLYNFAKYIEWPADFVPVSDNGEPIFVIGIVGDNPFGDALESIAAEKRLNDKRIVVKAIHRVEDAKSCHILFVPVSNNSKLVENLLKQTSTSPTLTVGEQNGFLMSGGILNFYLQENKVKFEIDSEAADIAQLKISSKLLNIARQSQTSN